MAAHLKAQQLAELGLVADVESFDEEVPSRTGPGPFIVVSERFANDLGVVAARDPDLARSRPHLLVVDEAQKVHDREILEQTCTDMLLDPLYPFAVAYEDRFHAVPVAIKANGTFVPFGTKTCRHGSEGPDGRIIDADGCAYLRRSFGEGFRTA